MSPLRMAKSAPKQTDLPSDGAASLRERTVAFRRALGAWFKRSQRPLPWRTEPSLYRTVVSEFMLQQTRVETVLPYFDRWMEAFPDFASLAAAPEDRVIRLWEGLGYYRRARNLHRLAKEIVTRGGNENQPFSHEPAEWERLPGVGAYTAAAITSIAFGTPAACVDGNVVRVLARLSGCERKFRDGGEAVRHFRSLAAEVLDPADPGAHNQAMMELGATVCQRKPRCGECPVRRFCAGHALKIADRIPDFPARRVERVEQVRIWVEQKDRILLWRAEERSSRLANLYELPTAEAAGLTRDTVRERGTLRLQGKRSITRYAITEFIYALPPAAVGSPAESRLLWVAREEIEELAFSGPHRRWVRRLLAEK